MKMKKSVKKRNFLVLIIILILVFGGYLIYNSLKPEILPSPGIHNVTRAFDKTTAKVREAITVSLAVDVDPADRVYSIEEVLPSDATVTDDGDGTATGNKWRYLKDDGGVPGSLVDITKTYVVTFSSSGTKTFSGTFVFNSEDLQTVGGATTLAIGCYEEDYDSIEVANTCDGCVSTGEIAAYINCWLTDCTWGAGDSVVEQLEVTYADNRWLTGVTSC